MAAEREKPSEMRYTLRHHTTTRPQNGGLPSETLYSIAARESRERGDVGRAGGAALAGDLGPRAATPEAAARGRPAGGDDPLRRPRLGAAVRAALPGGAAGRRRAAPLQAAPAVPRVRSRAGAGLHSLCRRHLLGGPRGAAGQRGGATAGGRVPDPRPDDSRGLPAALRRSRRRGARGGDRRGGRGGVAATAAPHAPAAQARAGAGRSRWACEAALRGPEGRRGLHPRRPLGVPAAGRLAGGDRRMPAGGEPARERAVLGRGGGGAGRGVAAGAAALRG